MEVESIVCAFPSAGLKFSKYANFKKCLLTIKHKKNIFTFNYI